MFSRTWALVGVLVLCCLAGCGHHAASSEAPRPDLLPEVIQTAQPPTPFVEFNNPNPNAMPQFIALGGDGNLWFSEIVGAGIIKVTPLGSFTKFGLAQNSSPVGIVSGDPNTVWFTEYGSGKIGKITIGGAITEFPLPNGGNPTSIAKGADGRMWFSEWTGNKIGAITTNGIVAEYGLPNGRNPSGITLGPDGNMWFTETGVGSIGRITPSGSVSEYPVGRLDWPAQITTIGNRMWFVESHDLANIATDGTLQIFRAPMPIGHGYGITAGPGNNPWLADNSKNRIVWYNVAGRQFHYYTVPRGRVASNPAGIVEGPDQNLWFTENHSAKIGVFVRLRLSVNPSALNFSGPGLLQTLKVSETLYRGLFSVAGCDPSIVTVSGKSPSFTVTSVGPGACQLTVADSVQNSTFVPVTVAGGNKAEH